MCGRLSIALHVPVRARLADLCCSVGVDAPVEQEPDNLEVAVLRRYGKAGAPVLQGRAACEGAGGSRVQGNRVWGVVGFGCGEVGVGGGLEDAIQILFVSCWQSA